MSVATRCPQCGTSLSADAPAGLCPECLLRQGLDSAAFSPSKTPTVIGAGFVPPAPAELDARFPQLEILELLGKGGMGAVYKARQRGLDRYVALKILPPEVGKDPAFAERFAREARSLARLNHQNIVAVYDFGEAAATVRSDPDASSVRVAEAVPATSDSLYYFVMEYVDGANLRQLIEGGHLTPAEALAIVPQICAALQFAHEEGIVHRDIKPENILVDRRGRVKIADFGLAKLLRVQPTDVTLTQARQVMGTWHYMAPEQVEHPQTVDHRADIYSLGVVFYEMLTGKLPLGRFEPPSQSSAVDARIDSVVLRALEREPERRYQFASEVKTDVENISGAAPLPAAQSNAARFQPLDLRPAQERVRNPAIGLFVTGLLYWLMIPLAFVLWSTRAISVDELHAGLWWSFFMQPALAGTLLMFGGAKMRRLEAHPLVVFAGIAPLVILVGNVAQMMVFRSFGFSPGDLVGPAMGLWALIVVTSPAVKSAFAATGDAGTESLSLTREEQDWRFWDATGSIIILLFLGLVAFGLWVTQSAWLLLALALPWAVPGIAAAVDKREEPSWYVLWVLILLVLASVGLIGYGIWLTKSGWPLLALAVPVASIGLAYCVVADEEEKNTGQPESESTAGDSSQSSPAEAAEKESDGWGCLIVPILIFVVAPLFQFVVAAVSDVNELVLEEFGLDPRLKRPLLAAIWMVVIGALAYTGYQLYEWFHTPETSGTAESDDGTSPPAVAEREGEHRRRLARLGGAISPVVVILVLVLLAPTFRGKKTSPVAPADPPTSSQASQLVQAAADGDTSRVRELLTAGADVNSVEPASGDTPLIRAAATGHTALVVTLILLGADVNAQNRQGHSALMLSAEHGRTATIRALFDLRQLTLEDDVEKRKAALRAFPGFDRTLIAGRDLDLADLKIEEMLRDKNGETASIKALRADDPACFELFANSLDNLLALDQRGRNVAMHAAIEGRVDLFRWLRHELYFGVAGVDNVYVSRMAMFDFESSLSLLDNDGKSALRLAVEHGQKEITDILRAHFEAIVARQTSEIEMGGENAALHRRLRGLALRALGQVELAKPDLASDPNSSSQELHDAAAAGDVATLRRLIVGGADVNALDPDTGETPLMKAAGNGQSAAAVVLLLRRANEQARDKKRLTPLMHAVLGGHTDLVQLLVEMSNISWDEEVQFRVSRLDTELPADTDFKLMHFDAALEAQDENGETALMKAAARGDVGLVTELLKWAHNETARDREGRTALMHAIGRNQTELLRAMIEGAEATLPHAPPGYTKTGLVTPEGLSITDQDGKTALVLAREARLEPIAAARQTYLHHPGHSHTPRIEAQGPYLWYIYHTRGHAYLGLGQTEAGQADLAKARELNRQKP